MIVPALLPAHGFGHATGLAPYSFDPDKAGTLLREAGYPNGLPLTLIASTDLEVQATVVSKMLEHGGFTVTQQTSGVTQLQVLAHDDVSATAIKKLAGYLRNDCQITFSDGARANIPGSSLRGYEAYFAPLL